MPLIPLALMAAAALGYEMALTRYFSVAHYSEYGYWVISMAMAGFAASGVGLSLLKDALLARREALLAWLPVLALIFAALGFYGVALNPFNALELQHPVLWGSQLLNIGKFYIALFPFFFSVGLYISLCFASFGAALPSLYAWDLCGGALGVALLLAGMAWVPPFYLVGLILPLPALAGWLSGKRALSLVLCVLLEALCIARNPAKPCQYKPLAFALNAPGSKVLARFQSPRGDYEILDDFTERLDIDLSNNAGMLGIPDAPATLGLYRDGERLAGLPKSGYAGTGYFKAALSSFPYELKPASALLIGTGGGYRLKEAEGSGASAITALEPDPELFKSLPAGLAVLNRQPLEFLAGSSQRFDLVDLAEDYSGPSQDEFAFSLEALRAYQNALSPRGLLSIGLSIKDFAPYALKLLEEARSLAPASQILAYRSAWNLRVLIFKQDPGEATRRRLQDFCSKRSFDIVWGSKNLEIFNDLPSLGWAGDNGAPGPQDALADEAKLIFSGQSPQSAADFDLRPATLDRPFFYSALKLSQPGAILRHLDLLPREELGSLVNVAVLLQAVLLSLAVLLLPLLFGSRVSLGKASFLKMALYFACLGLGYMFFEVSLIEKISPYLQDRAFAFALVLGSMLVFSGLGSALAPRVGARSAFLILFAWLALAWLGLDRLLLLIWGWPLAPQALACSLAIAPLAFALGIPFPLGLLAVDGDHAALPWAWSVNGAFSVLAPPLAYLGARELGYEAVAGLAFLVYFLAWVFFPKAGKA